MGLISVSGGWRVGDFVKTDQPLAAFTEDRRSLPEVHGTVAVPSGFWRKMLAFAGPGYLVAVGYMDPGNWATDIAGGAQFGYTLLSVVMISNLMAILLQALAARLGIVSRPRPRAGLPRQLLAARSSSSLWILCEIAIAACDLAEVLGAAIALNLLFGMPLLVGVRHHGARRAGRAVPPAAPASGTSRCSSSLLIVGIAACFVVELWLSQARARRRRWRASSRRRRSSRDKDMLYIAIGILGATVMPHNLYLHSSIVQTRKYARHDDERAERDPVRDHRLDGRAVERALHQRRHPDRGGGDVPRHGLRGRRARSRTPTRC